MTDDMTRGDLTASADPAELEERLAQAEERLSFYTSFDKLIQDNIARSSELMQDALALRDKANADIRRTQAEMERVEAEAAEAVAATNAQAVEERRHFSETLLALHAELGSLQDDAAAIGRRVGTVLGELGAAEFVPVAWAAPAETDEADAVVADAAIDEAVEALEAESGGTADADVWSPLAPTGEETISTGDLIAYQGTGTGELSLEGAGDDSQVAELFPSTWETEAPAYPAVDPENAEGLEALEAESAESSFDASFEAEAVASEATEDEFASLEDFEAAIAALEANDSVEDEGAIAGEVEPLAEAIRADGEADAGEADELLQVEAADLTDDEEADASPDVAFAEGAEGAPTIPGPDDVDVYAATSFQAPPADAYEVEIPPTYREEGFLGGFAAEPDRDEALAAEAELESAVAVETADEPRAVMVLVHGVPRAAAALSLQRHLAGLGHVEGVEAREYAEGILRLQVTARAPLALDDLRAWDGGAELEPVHVQDDVIEVRLPGAVGF